MGGVMAVKKTGKNARWIALQILMKLEQERSNSGVLLQRKLTEVPDAKDRHLITDLVLGTLRWRGRLLFLIDSFSSKRRLDREVSLILQLGIYQLVFTGIPQHAAIHETVDLCRKGKLSSAVSFVNGILRKVQSGLASLPELDGNPSMTLSIRWSHPLWLVQRWLERFGEEEAVALMRINNEPAPVYIRLSQDSKQVVDLLRNEGIEVETTVLGPLLFRIRKGAPQKTRFFENGLFYIHDAGVEVLGGILGVKPGMRVLEIAAAPGGKTFQIASRMNGQGSIVSLDTEVSRMKIWKENIRRLKIRCALPVVADARRLPFDGRFDLVVVDAPCSSLGVIGRHPEVKWWKQPQDLIGYRRLQLEILDSCVHAVAGGGALVYSVCSFEPEETAQVKEQFLAAHPEFSLVEERYLYPHRDGTDGFYIARLRSG